jgi:hypothetical protein
MTTHLKPGSTHKNPVMINGTVSRILVIIAMLALVYGSYTAFSEDKPGMAILLAFGAIAAAIPTFFTSKN